MAQAGDGAGLFLQNCALCHQANGNGLPGQFPRLAGRVGPISSQDQGRRYLIDVLTYGLAGTILVDGQSITGVMPPLSTLSDDVVADILSYVQTLGPKGASPPRRFSREEVAAARGKSARSLDEVQKERQLLQGAKIIE